MLAGFHFMLACLLDTNGISLVAWALSTCYYRSITREILCYALTYMYNVHDIFYKLKHCANARLGTTKD